MENGKTEFSGFIPDGRRTGERKKYFSFGLSLIDDETNVLRITALKNKIAEIKRRTGTSGLSNVDFIETLINYVSAKLTEKRD